MLGHRQPCRNCIELRSTLRLLPWWWISVTHSSQYNDMLLNVFCTNWRQLQHHNDWRPYSAYIMSHKKQDTKLSLVSAPITNFQSSFNVAFSRKFAIIKWSLQILLHLKCWYSFYHLTEGRRLSRPKHCSKGVQPMPKAVYHSDVYDKHATAVGAEQESHGHMAWCWTC